MSDKKKAIYIIVDYALTLLVGIQADSGIITLPLEFRQGREELPSNIITMFILHRELMVLVAAVITLHINIENVDTTCWLWFCYQHKLKRRKILVLWMKSSKKKRKKQNKP
jgi:hypothetical protein